MARDRRGGSPPPTAVSTDLTRRARIRDAGLRLFSERGTEGATVRDIARAASVSPGLVRHHFGSKEGLRAACDAFVLERGTEIKERALFQGELDQPELLLMHRYLARSMVEGSGAAASMFDRLVQATQLWLERHAPSETPDPRGRAALLIAMELGALVMREVLSRALGSDTLSPEGSLRVARAKLELYSQPLLSADAAARARAAMDALGERLDAAAAGEGRPATGAGDPGG